MILLMYFLAGINKVLNFNSTVLGLKSKLLRNKLPLIIYKFIIFLVIVLEICAPILILTSVQTNKYNLEAYYSCVTLGLFTILATILYHFPPYGANYYAFMKNLTATGALFLLSNYIY
jgi:uncharacterized membrane protein YphA (DoxX/SURF4 family)